MRRRYAPAGAGLGADEQQHGCREHDERHDVDPGRHGDGGDEPDGDQGDAGQQRHPRRDDDVVERDR
jgi:hypothetical protein